ncbi:hypothetical protein V6N13_016876 [Hibiscus sabdariffa]
MVGLLLRMNWPKEAVSVCLALLAPSVVWILNLSTIFSVSATSMGPFGNVGATFRSFVWSILLFRNDIAFRGSRLDVSQLFDLCLTRTGWWCKSKFPGSSFVVGEVVRCPLVLRNIVTEHPLSPPSV